MKAKVKNPIDVIDRLLFQTITNDIVNGSLLTESDSETLELVLIGIWEDIERFESSGVIIGEAWWSSLGGAGINREPSRLLLWHANRTRFHIGLIFYNL